jgi:hypothetical protein
MLLNRALPNPSGCEVVWSPAARWLLVGTTSAKMIESFLEHFESAFRTFPVPLYHAQWAVHQAGLDDRLKDQVSATVPLKSVRAFEDGRFLGHDFLTWLWYAVDCCQGLFTLSEDRMVQIELGERVVLRLPGDSREKVVCTTQAQALFEARTALQQGKMVDEAQFLMKVGGDNEYTFTLDSSLWPIKGLRAPKQMAESEDEDRDSRFLEKMYLLEEFLSAINGVYREFLRQRVGGGWESDILPLISEWIGKKAESGSTQSVPF